MNSILLIGKPHSTKTTFLAQLCSRIESGNCAITLYKPIENLTPIIDASKALAHGKEVNTTPTEKSVVVELPLSYKGEQIDLNCPDYGGEQINKIIEDREIGPKWTKAIKESNSWILFIRPSNLSTAYDLSNKTIKTDILETARATSDEYQISDQSFFIELLQILLHAKGQDAHFKNEDVKITLVLTCWDELENPQLPHQELQNRLPLLLEFIESNWTESQLSVIGLSSQGFSLKNADNQKKYMEQGPESFGYMVNKDGTQSVDLTEVITTALW